MNSQIQNEGRWAALRLASHDQRDMPDLNVHLIRLIPLSLLVAGHLLAGEPPLAEADLSGLYSPPAEFRNDFGSYRSPLRFEDGHRVTTSAEWGARRKQILHTWLRIIGPWPELLVNPNFEKL